MAMTGRLPSRTRAAGQGRNRVHQGTIDKMAELRRQGLTFGDIGAKVGCSERTARRYSGRVKPALHLPGTHPERPTDPRTLRHTLLNEFLNCLYRNEDLRAVTMTWHRTGIGEWRAEYGLPPSILFLSEAERLLRERLESIGVLSLRLLAADRRSKVRFLSEVVGYLCRDYVACHKFAQNLGDPFDTGDDWRPPPERK